MLDDRLDKSLPDDARKDYWYVNHKLMQSGPDIHTYADMWGDIRGRTLYPNEARVALLNLGGINANEAGTFVDVAEALGIDAPNNSRGVLLADLDNDGDLDAVITNQHDQVSVYQSTLRQALPARSHYVNVALRGAGSNTHGVGARVTVTTTPADGVAHAQVQQLDVLAGFSAMHPETLHFGVGEAAGSAQVDVVFPGGARSSASTPVDRTITVQESAP